MAYLTSQQLKELGLQAFGQDVKISDKACIYDPRSIIFGSHVRVDDFCIISGQVKIGDYCHITPYCLVAGGETGVELADFCTLAYGAKVFAQSDDYSGQSMVSSLIPRKYKNEFFAKVRIGRQTVIGAGSTVMPGADVADGCSIGANSLVLTPTEPWGIYAGSPAERIKERSQELLALEQKFLSEQ